MRLPAHRARRPSREQHAEPSGREVSPPAKNVVVDLDVDLDSSSPEPGHGPGRGPGLLLSRTWSWTWTWTWTPPRLTRWLPGYPPSEEKERRRRRGYRVTSAWVGE